MNTTNPTASLSNTRMAQVAQVVLALPDVRGDLLPGPFESSDMQLVIQLRGGGTLSVLPDLDTAALYEAVRYSDENEPTDQLWDKLTLQGVIDLVNKLRADGVGPAGAG